MIWWCAMRTIIQSYAATKRAIPLGWMCEWRMEDMMSGAVRVCTAHTMNFKISNNQRYRTNSVCMSSEYKRIFLITCQCYWRCPYLESTFIFNGNLYEFLVWYHIIQSKPDMSANKIVNVDEWTKGCPFHQATTINYKTTTIGSH